MMSIIEFKSVFLKLPQIFADTPELSVSGVTLRISGSTPQVSTALSDAAKNGLSAFRIDDADLIGVDELVPQMDATWMCTRGRAIVDFFHRNGFSKIDLSTEPK